MAYVDLHFPVLGESIPTDHGYALYSSASKVIPKLHEPDAPIRIAPISGDYIGERLLRIDPHNSRLRIRLPAEEIPTMLPLAGKSLVLAGHSVRIGVPNVRALIPATTLIARMVIIKGFTEPEAFLDAVARQLQQLDIAGEPGIPVIQDGPHREKPRRHVLRIKDKRVIGFSLQVQGLSAEESLRLQENGIGGRGKMGCGFFVPLLPRRQS